jgi:hypothetical protein
MVEQDLEARVVREFSALFLSDDLASERRRARRIPCTPTRVIVRVDERPTPVEAEVLNISKAGIGLRTASAMTLGWCVQVDMEHSVVTAKVRYCQMNENGTFHIGLEILHIMPRV